jgi:hypothetical protein
MFLTIHRHRVALDPGVWISPEEIMRRAVAASAWPRNKIYLEWDFGHEPIHTMEELAFACRLVQTNHCRNMEYDYGEIFSMDDDEVRLLSKPRIYNRPHPRGDGLVAQARTPVLQAHPFYLPVRVPRRKRRAHPRPDPATPLTMAEDCHNPPSCTHACWGALPTTSTTGSAIPEDTP